MKLNTENTENTNKDINNIENKDAPAPKNKFDTKDRFTSNRKLSFSPTTSSNNRSKGLLLGLMISCWLIVFIVWFTTAISWDTTSASMWGEDDGEVTHHSFKIWQWNKLRSITVGQNNTAKMLFGASLFTFIVGIAGTLIISLNMFFKFKNKALLKKVYITLTVLGIISVLCLFGFIYFASDMSSELKRQELDWLQENGLLKFN